jgi:hypothetical protein
MVVFYTTVTACLYHCSHKVVQFSLHVSHVHDCECNSVFDSSGESNELEVAC